MQKFWAAILFLASFSAVSAVEAKVCFLPGVLSEDGCLDDDNFTRCNGYERTSPCPSGYEQSTCVSGGVTYYRCSCRSDNVLVLGTKYKCLGNFDSACGCAAKDTVCNTDFYPYQGCQQYPGTVQSDDFCTSPRDGKVYYKSCDCPPGVYPYDCKETGLQEPTNASMCEPPSGEKMYSFCLCEDNWTTTPCSSRDDGCTNLLDSVFNGLDTCYHCTVETCPIETDVNLDGYWCSLSENTQINCQALGYTVSTDGKCPSGLAGIKCPYNDGYIFCPNG